MSLNQSIPPKFSLYLLLVAIWMAIIPVAIVCIGLLHDYLFEPCKHLDGIAFSNDTYVRYYFGVTANFILSWPAILLALGLAIIAALKRDLIFATSLSSLIFHSFLVASTFSIFVLRWLIPNYFGTDFPICK